MRCRKIELRPPQDRVVGTLKIARGRSPAVKLGTQPIKKKWLPKPSSAGTQTETACAPTKNAYGIMRGKPILKNSGIKNAALWDCRQLRALAPLFVRRVDGSRRAALCASTTTTTRENSAVGCATTVIALSGFLGTLHAALNSYSRIYSEQAITRERKWSLEFYPRFATRRSSDL